MVKQANQTGNKQASELFHMEKDTPEAKQHKKQQVSTELSCS